MSVFETTGTEFKTQVLDADLPVLLEFTADWCPPCKMLKPIIHQLADKHAGKLKVAMIDTDKNLDIVQTYGVMGFPTMLLFIGGQPVERLVGFMPLEKIESKILPHLVTEQA